MFLNSLYYYLPKAFWRRRMREQEPQPSQGCSPGVGSIACSESHKSQDKDKVEIGNHAYSKEVNDNR